MQLLIWQRNAPIMPPICPCFPSCNEMLDLSPCERRYNRQRTRGQAPGHCRYHSVEVLYAVCSQSKLSLWFARIFDSSIYYHCSLGCLESPLSASRYAALRSSLIRPISETVSKYRNHSNASNSLDCDDRCHLNAVLVAVSQSMPL